jgi:hypothetical protein
MRKSLIYVVLLFTIFLIPVSSQANTKALVIPKAALSLNYWDADLIKSFPTFSENSSQKFFPVFIGSARIGKSKYSAIAEWGESKFGSVTSMRPNLEEKASRTVFGLRLDSQPGLYFTLSYPMMRLNINNKATLGATTANITGLQVGMGFGAYLKQPHITAGVEINNVPDMSVKYSSGALSGKAKGPGYDVKANVAYKFSGKGNAVYVGYRMMALDAGAVTIGNYPMPKVKFTLRGPIAGFKYVF